MFVFNSADEVSYESIKQQFNTYYLVNICMYLQVIVNM